MASSRPPRTSHFVYPKGSRPYFRRSQAAAWDHEPMSETPKLPRLPKLSPGEASSSSAPAKPSKPNPRHPYALGGQGRTLGEMLPSLGDLTGYPNGIGGPRSKDS